MATCMPAVSRAAAEEPSFLALGLGYFDILDDRGAAEFRAEYRHGKGYWIFLPFAGASVTSDGAVYPYAGIYSNFDVARRVVVSPSAAIGAYFKGGGKDLGHVFEIRSALEIAYQFDDRSKLGLSFHHISNAGLEDLHRGAEVLSLTYSLPLN